MEPYDPYAPRAPKQAGRRSTGSPPAVDNDGNPIVPDQDLDHVRDEADAAHEALHDGALKRRARVGKVLSGKPNGRPSTGSGSKAAHEETAGEAASAVAASQLRAFIERIERLAEEKQAIADDIKEVYAEAKATGFDTKAVRHIVKLRKLDDGERLEAEAIIDLYKAALGMP